MLLFQLLKCEDFLIFHVLFDAFIHVIEIAIWPSATSKSQELQFFDKGKMCHNIPLQMKHCGVTEMPRPTNHILQM